MKSQIQNITMDSTRRLNTLAIGFVVFISKKKSPSWEMGKDYTQQFVVSLRGFPCL